MASKRSTKQKRQRTVTSHTFWSGVTAWQQPTDAPPPKTMQKHPRLIDLFSTAEATWAFQSLLIDVGIAVVEWSLSSSEPPCDGERLWVSLCSVSMRDESSINLGPWDKSCYLLTGRIWYSQVGRYIGIPMCLHAIPPRLKEIHNRILLCPFAGFVFLYNKQGKVPRWNLSQNFVHPGSSWPNYSIASCHSGKTRKQRQRERNVWVPMLLSPTKSNFTLCQRSVTVGNINTSRAGSIPVTTKDGKVHLE